MYQSNAQPIHLRKRRPSFRENQQWGVSRRSRYHPQTGRELAYHRASQRMLNVESEVNQLKGAYGYLATKADLEKAKWQLGGLMITAIGLATAILVVAIRFWS